MVLLLTSWLLRVYKSVSGPLNQDIAEIPWVRVWASWDAMLQEPWDKVVECANPGQVASSLVKVATYSCWFMIYRASSSGGVGCRLSPGHAKVYKTHIRDTFCICEAVNEVPYGCKSPGY
jgi:hypothetical protein